LSSEKVSRAIFQSNWIRSNKKYKTAVKLMMENSKKSIEISAFHGLLDINLGTFQQILNGAYSLYAVFKKINVVYFKNCHEIKLSGNV
jgi:hypothetical protein